MRGSTASRVANSQASQTHMLRTPSTAARLEDTSHLHPLLRLQQTVGNRAVARIIEAQLAVSDWHRRDPTNRAFASDSSSAKRQASPDLNQRSSRATDAI